MSKLSLGCNLSKSLSKNRRDDQLVKCKNTELYLYLYIFNNYKERKRYPRGNNKERIRKT